MSAEDVAAVERDGQARLWWDGVPVDVFLNNLPLHEAAAEGVVWVPLRDRRIPVLDCASLAIFKSLLGRGRDWVDIEAIADAAPEDVEIAVRTVADLLGRDDPAFGRLARIGTTSPP